MYEQVVKTEMPWRLQIAVAAMTGYLASNASEVGSRIVPQFFLLADAMLAEHERTTPPCETC